MRLECQSEGIFPVSNMEKRCTKDENKLCRKIGGSVARRFARVRIASNVTCALAIFGIAGVAQVRAQTPAPSAAPLAVEVASIKPSADIVVAVSAGKMPHVGLKIDNQSVDIG